MGRPDSSSDAPPVPPEFEFFNGLGGFVDGGREYVTILGEGQWTPAPWINVIANPNFGFQVSESGAGYTWCLNSRENQLTPWSNDPVSDPPGEVLYIRDEETGTLWGPTVLPIREETWPYVARHGQGYSRFEHTSHGISLDLLQFVPPEDPVKISRLVVENRSDRSRRLSVTATSSGCWARRAAPPRRSSSPRSTRTPGRCWRGNAWNLDFGNRVAFADLGRVVRPPGPAIGPSSWAETGRWTIRRRWKAGSRSRAASGAGLDPCAAAPDPGRVARRWPRGASMFLLGQTATRRGGAGAGRRYRTIDVDAVLQAVKTQWDDIVGAVQVRTPDRSMDVMLNRWLLYQTLACRVWARAAFYQAGARTAFAISSRTSWP